MVLARYILQRVIGVVILNVVRRMVRVFFMHMQLVVRQREDGEMVSCYELLNNGDYIVNKYIY